ncbi:hypothetical protein DPMN_040818 [Dreissena polymorpha]|uniref:Uncharacterized protein n=1 Tax=Dreissena polymorpha TaxID=45954 RepID=A0A9D4HVJ4_DREPO|nr:hypothetical protein DPMN_040818 [Dreissena polymorpha]
MVFEGVHENGGKHEARTQPDLTSFVTGTGLDDFPLSWTLAYNPSQNCCARPMNCLLNRNWL